MNAICGDRRRAKTAPRRRREALRIEGECVYRVPPLEVPSEHWEEPSDVLGRSAVELLVARMLGLDSDFSPDSDGLAAIAAICRHLDGIPLAIEFAATRAAALGLEQVASRLDDRFTLLTGGRRTALPRHRTLRAMLDWSYELLPEAQRRLFRRLAVFPGGFTLEAAAVAGDSTAPAGRGEYRKPRGGVPCDAGWIRQPVAGDTPAEIVTPRTRR
jgi:non-specific serine/threonine protein kinase